MKKNHISATLAFMAMALCHAFGAVQPSPLATQSWVERKFYDAIQETGRTNVLTAADRQMISNYVDEVCRLYAARATDPGADGVAFADGKLVYTVGEVVVSNEVTLGFRAYTNAGMRVSTSTLVETPAGALFAWDGANSRYVNGARAPYELLAAWTYIETTNVLWRSNAAAPEGYLVTNVSMLCVMKLTGSADGCDYVSQQVGDTWIVRKRLSSTGAAMGEFTLVPQAISDAQRDACMASPSARLRSFRRAFSFLDLLVPAATAVPYEEPPSSKNAGDFFLSVKIDDLYYEVQIPPMNPIRSVGVVDDGGSYYSGPRQFAPSPYESFDDWCNPANRWGESISISIPFATPAGTVDYIQKTLSAARFERMFPELLGGLAALYKFPQEVVKPEPCSKEDGGHDWGTDSAGCVCRKCKTRRECAFEHPSDNIAYCKTCVNFLGPEYESSSPHDRIEHEDDDPRCDRVSPFREDHAGWHQSAVRVTDRVDNVNYWLYHCLCQCGRFGGDEPNAHDFSDDDLGEWTPGEDEFGTNADLYHHAYVQCARMTGVDRCDGNMPKKELHDVLRSDGALMEGASVYPIKNSGGVLVECLPDDPDARLDYHGIAGTCAKCLAEIESFSHHDPDPDNECLCLCGMHVHSVPDQPDDCGNYRCQRCDAWISNAWSDEEYHGGAVAHEGDAVSHWCYCGRMAERHEEYIRVSADGSKYCDACGYVFEVADDGGNSVRRYRATKYPNIKNGQGSGISSSAWGGGTNSVSSVDGDLMGDVPDGLSESDIVNDPSATAANIESRGWTLVSTGISTRRYWYNLWMKTYRFENTYRNTNAAGERVEFTLVHDLGFTFWED